MRYRPCLLAVDSSATITNSFNIFVVLYFGVFLLPILGKVFA